MGPQDRCKEELREEAAAVGQARKAAEMAEKRAAEATLEHRIEKEKVMKLLEENSELQRSTQVTFCGVIFCNQW